MTGTPLGDKRRPPSLRRDGPLQEAQRQIAACEQRITDLELLVSGLVKRLENK